MKCPECGANIEVTEFDDGTTLVRQDCLCDASKKNIRQIATKTEETQ